MPSFKELEFHSGLNILLAEKSPDATEKQTRNGAGKTSLIEIIHFLMGSDRGSLFSSKALSPYTFGMEIDIKGRRILVERSGQKASDIILRGSINDIVFDMQDQSSLFGVDQQITIPNNQWKDILGREIFGLAAYGNEQLIKYAPSFRSLFTFFVRRQMSGAFMSPYKHTSQQQTWDQQVAISYLLGLDWGISSDWQVVRDQERNLRELKKAAEEGTFGEIIGKSADLRTRLIIADDKVRRLRGQLGNFQILPQYREIEIEASQVSRQIGSLSDENAIDRELVAQLEQSLHSELSASSANVAILYEEAGIVLSDIVIRRFEEVQSFHNSVVQNRRTYLAGEIEAAQRRIDERQRKQAQLNTRQSELFSILRSHGALDQYYQLQSELTRLEGDAEALRRQFSTAEQLEGKKTELDIERTRLLRRLQQDYIEQKDVLQRSILVFEQISSALYEQAGSLQIEESLNGPVFDIKMQGDKSKGISSMQIFCFDMMFMRLCHERGIGPGFLVHDSHLFDGVDERQIAKALEVGEAITQEIQIQYIVTMNSDTFPKGLVANFDIDRYLLPVQLTDATETGGLFGIRFD